MQAITNTEKVLQALFNTKLSDFYRFLSYKSVSTQPKFKEHTLKTANWLKQYLRKLGFENTTLLYPKDVVDSDDVYPAVYGEYIVDPKLPTIIFYGHYDVQPADEPDWQGDPFVPRQQAGRIYARGASDNKGRLWATLLGLDYYINKIPTSTKRYNIKVFFEGEEEIGSKHAPYILRQHRELLSHNLLYVNDLSQIDDNTPTLIYSLRGLVYVEVYLRTGSTYAHSGHYGNLVLNASQLAAYLVFKLKDIWRNRVRIPQLYKKVRRPPKQEIEYLRTLSPSWEDIKHSSTFFAVTLYRSAQEGELAPIHLATLRPSLDVHGIKTGIIEPGVTKTAIPYQAMVKFSLRLVPYLEPDFVVRRLKHYIDTLLKRFKGVEYEIKIYDTLPYYFEDPSSEVIKKVAEVVKQVYGKQPVVIPAGGSIGMVSYWKQVFPNSKIVLHGIASPNDRIHGSNESIKLSTIIKGAHTVVRLLESDIVSSNT